MDFCPKVLIYNHTASVPVGWYIVIPSNNYHAGDYVVFKVPHDIQSLAVNRGWMKENDTMLKIIGAVEGDTYRAEKDSKRFLINEKYIGEIFLHDKDGRSLPTHFGEFVVGRDEFLPISYHPFSFDGRYFGCVSVKNIKYKVIPIPFLTD